MGQAATMLGAPPPPAPTAKQQKAAMLDSELKGAGFSAKKIDDMVAAANDVIGCGPACQRQRRIDKLETAVNTARDNVDNGPTKLKKAQRDLITYRDGTAAYTESMREQYEREAQEVGDAHRAQHKKNMDVTNTLIAELSTGETYVGNARQLLEDKMAKHDELTKNIDRDTGIVRTNNRRGEYQAESTEKYDTINKALKVIYYIIFTIYVGLVVIYRGNYKSKKQWAIVVLFAIFPFVIVPQLFNLLSAIMNLLGHWLTNQAPKDANYNL